MDNKDQRRQIIRLFSYYRKLNGKTQKQVAELAGTARPNIARFESGEYNPTLDLMIRMADALDMNLEVTLAPKKKENEEKKKED